MKDAEAKLRRAQAILLLLERKSQALPRSLSEEERNGKAMSFLDRVLGPLWRKEIESADLQLPENIPSCDKSIQLEEKLEAMYKKVKKLLNKEGYHGTSFPSEKLNGEEASTDNKEDISHARILIIGR